ncbi:MAG: FecR domain-containing protein, partial [Elusimicrobia bacterium]|nr:FecR domain-containing protein [Elusimicrobiota bacterium]
MKMLLAAVSMFFLFAAPARAAESLLAARLADVIGRVSARVSSTAPWVQVKSGAMLAAGGEVKTEVGSGVVIVFSDGNKVFLAPRTTFAVEGATTLKTSLRLFSGRIECWVKRTNNANFAVRHRSAVASVRGTVFAMEGTDSAVKIDLFSGGLDIVDSFGRPSSLTSGQRAEVAQDTGLQGISTLPPDAVAPKEPDVAPPPPPPADMSAKDDGTPPEDKPAEDPEKQADADEPVDAPPPN